MAFASGQKLTAARLNRLQPKTYEASVTSTVPITAAGVDLGGASITLTTESAGATYVVDASFDITQLATTNNDANGLLNIDGVDQSKRAPVGGQVSGDRATVSQTWRGTLAAAGSHTFKLRANATADSQYQANPTSTSIVVMILEVV